MCAIWDRWKLETHFLFIGLFSRTNATALQTLKHTWVVEQRIPWDVLHTNNVCKNSQRVFPHAHTHAHTHISGDGVAFGHYKMLTQSLFHTFTDSNCHLDPSGGFGHQKRTHTHCISDTRHIAHYVFMHSYKNKHACALKPFSKAAQLSNWYKKCWLYIGLYVKVCHISFNVCERAQVGPLPGSFRGQTEHQFSLPIRSRMWQSASRHRHTHADSEWMGQSWKLEVIDYRWKRTAGTVLMMQQCVCGYTLVCVHT